MSSTLLSCQIQLPEDAQATQPDQQGSSDPMSIYEAYQNKKLERVGLMTSSVAHDFNNLLTSIIGHLSIAATMMTEADDARPFVKKALLSADRATYLVKNLLEFTSKGSTNREELAVSSFVRALMPVFGWICADHTTIVLDLDEPLPAIRIVKADLQQLLLNLVTNAADAMKPTGGTITIATHQVAGEAIPQPAALGSVQFGQQYLCICVSDTGIGMEDETLHRISEPFFTTKESGFGIGLTILNHLVESYDAVCHITSEYGVGSQFAIYLPLTESQ